MKKLLVTMSLVLVFFIGTAVSASAVVNDTLKVGLRYGSEALDIANLENAVGEGYLFGYFDADREFVELDRTDVTTVSVKNEDGNLTVIITGTDEILYVGDDGERLGILPYGDGERTETWFKGYKYPGGFEYTAYNGRVQVVNVVNLEEYVKGVIPFEMSDNWPEAALEAQAVCARTYANKVRHNSYGFDICNTTDCQVYYGRGSGRRGPSEHSDRAVENTAGEMLCYDGIPVETPVYHSHDGGATEDAKNVWGSEVPYLRGKKDPYESQTTIPSYRYSVTYTADELAYILSQKGYDVGTVKNVYVSQFTDNGNVRSITFEGEKGTKTVLGETCRTIFYSSTYNKSVRSMRFTINGSGVAESKIYINDARNVLQSLDGVYVISGSGTKATLSGESYTVMTSSGKKDLETGTPGFKVSGDGYFLIEGTGNGHNVGMSQYGAKAMAELGYTHVDILEFYYTDISVE